MLQVRGMTLSNLFPFSEDLLHLGNGMCLIQAAYVSSEIVCSSGILFLPECPPWEMTDLRTIQDVQMVLPQS